MNNTGSLWYKDAPHNVFEVMDNLMKNSVEVFLVLDGEGTTYKDEIKIIYFIGYGSKPIGENFIGENFNKLMKCGGLNKTLDYLESMIGLADFNHTTQMELDEAWSREEQASRMVGCLFKESKPNTVN